MIPFAVTCPMRKRISFVCVRLIMTDCDIIFNIFSSVCKGTNVIDRWLIRAVWISASRFFHKVTCIVIYIFLLTVTFIP